MAIGANPDEGMRRLPTRFWGKHAIALRAKSDEAKKIIDKCYKKRWWCHFAIDRSDPTFLIVCVSQHVDRVEDFPNIKFEVVEQWKEEIYE